jgi:hypothetical protein
MRSACMVFKRTFPLWTGKDAAGLNMVAQLDSLTCDLAEADIDGSGLDADYVG